MEIYAMVTRQCDLNCRHCSIRSQEDDYNEELFLEKLRDPYVNPITLIGGEPLLHKDRIRAILNDPIIADKSMNINTNLMLLDDEIVNDFLTRMTVTTSWDLGRFTQSQYEHWLSNIDILKSHGIRIRVNITITPDLIKWGHEKFIDMIHSWDPMAVKEIALRYFLHDGLTRDYYHQADQWMADIYRKWNTSIHNCLAEGGDSEWSYCNCTGMSTLMPNGVVKPGCIFVATNTVHIKSNPDCYTCAKAQYCRMCPLMGYCSDGVILRRYMAEDREKYGITNTRGELRMNGMYNG